MIIHKFTIDVYDWDVTFFSIHKHDVLISFSQQLRKLNVPKSFIQDLINFTNKGQYGGNHLYDASKRESEVIIYNCNTLDRINKCLSHELRHMEDRIAEQLILEGSEALAYLSGYIASEIYPLVYNMKSII